MAVEFDPVKDERNLAEHGLSLATASFIFDGRFIEEVDGRRDYGETRFIATGPVEALDGRIFVAIYTWRGSKRRIISFRKANDREQRRYGAAFP